MKGTRRIVSRGGEIRGLRTKVPQRGSGVDPGGVWGQSPQKLKTGCENNAKIICLLSVLL